MTFNQRKEKTMNTTNEKKSLYLVFKEQFFAPDIDPDFEPVDDETYDQSLDDMIDSVFIILSSYVLNPDNTVDPNYKDTIPNGCTLDEITKADEWEEIYSWFLSELEKRKDQKDLTVFIYDFASECCQF